MSKNRLLYVVVLTALAFSASACGGSPTAPTDLIPPGPGPQPGSTKLVLHSFLGGPAANVPVTVDGNRATTDENGVATFNVALRPGTPLAIDAGLPWLKHECIYQGDEVHPHALFPVDDGSGFTREFVRWLAFNGEYGENWMERMVKPGAVSLSGWSAEEEAILRSATQTAVGIASAIHDFRFVEAPSAGTVPVEIVPDPGMSEHIAGLTYRETVNWVIVRVRITIDPDLINYPPTLSEVIAHELGHAFGFGHSLEPGKMGSPREPTFSAHERQVADFMKSRPPGTRWEDVFP